MSWIWFLKLLNSACVGLVSSCWTIPFKNCTHFRNSITHVPGCVWFTLEWATHFLQIRFTIGNSQLSVHLSFSFQARNHTDFLCRMKEYLPSRSVFTDGVITALGEHFSVQPTDLETVLSPDEEFSPSTKLLSEQDLEEIVSSKGSSHRVQKAEEAWSWLQWTLFCCEIWKRSSVSGTLNHWLCYSLFRAILRIYFLWLEAILER